MKVNSGVRRRRARNALTIVELLVVCGILAVLFALLLPALQMAREQARNAQCTGHEREFGVAFHAFHEAHRRLPAGWCATTSPHVARGWAGRLLPYLELSSVDPVCLSALTPADGQVRQILPLFLCPSDVGEAQVACYRELGEHASSGQSSEEIAAMLPMANYVGVFGTSDPDSVPGEIGEGAFRAPHGARLEDLRRGASNVALLSERTARKLPGTWSDFPLDGEDAAGRVTGNAFLGPNREDADECEFDSRHRDHINVLWGDGRVTQIVSAVDRMVYQSMARRE